MRLLHFCFKMRSACLLRTAVKSSLRGTREVLNSILTAAILHDDEEEVVPDEKKAIFYAAAELAVRCFSLKPETYINSRVMT
jgi:hypothetical protein